MYSWCAKAIRKASGTGTISCDRASPSSRPIQDSGVPLELPRSMGLRAKALWRRSAGPRVRPEALRQRSGAGLGARGATTTFVERGIGDGVTRLGKRAFLAVKELGPDKVEIVVPSISILAERPSRSSTRSSTGKARGRSPRRISITCTRPRPGDRGEELLSSDRSCRGGEIRQAVRQRSALCIEGLLRRLAEGAEDATSPTAARSTRSTSPATECMSASDEAKTRRGRRSSCNRRPVALR